MDPLSLAASITAVAAATFEIVGFLNSIATGGKDRLRLLTEITGLWMSITSLKGQIAPDGVPIEEMSYKNLLPLFEPNGVIKQIETAVDQLMDKLKNRAGHGKVWQTLTWPFDKTDVDRTVEHIHRLQQTLNLSLTQSNNALAREIHKDGAVVRSAMESQQVRAIIDWLTPLNFVAKQDLLFKEHHEGTCKWFLESEEFKEWKSMENSVLFCPGNPGAGKTFLSSIVVNELDKLRFDEAKRENAAVLMLYCKWDDPLGQSIDSLVASLLKQLVQKYDRASPDLTSMYTHHHNKDTRPSRADMLKVLAADLSLFKRTFVIVDGLDEILEEKNRLLVLELLSALPCKINIMITSRPLNNIVQHFVDSGIFCDGCNAKKLRYQHHCTGCTKRSYDLCQQCVDKGLRCKRRRNHEMVKQFNSFIVDIRAVEEDLEIYVHWRITTSDFLRQCVRKKEALLNEILNKVVYANDGMFLLAKFNMDTLASKLTPGAVSMALQTLPKELDGTYTEAMERIQDLSTSHKDLAMYFLQWVAYAERPLQIREIEHAVAVAIGSHEIDHDEIVRADVLTSMCAGLVVFDEASCVRLVHYSAENYFKGHRNTWFPEGNAKLATVCLTYLLFDAFKAGPCIGPTESADFDIRKNKYPLLGYASMYWGHHLRQTSQPECQDLVMKFLTSGKPLESSVQALWYLDSRNSLSWAVKSGTSPLHLASHFGLSIVGELVRTGSDPNARDSAGTTPLMLAAETGYVEVAAMLVQAGASVNSTDDIGGTALHLAASLDEPKMVEFLLNQDGIDVNMPHTRWNHHTALMLAAENGYTDVISHLLRVPQLVIDQEATTPRGQTALMRAATFGHADAVELLLTHPKININHQDRHGATSLLIAARNGYTDVVQVLLDKGADTEVTETPGGGDGTALLRAIDYNRVEIVRLLMERGANVHHKDIFDRGMLHGAAVNGRAEILRVMLEANTGLDVNAQDVNGKTTLHDASRFGYYDTIEVLLEFGGDPTIKDKDGRTPLRVAREKNRPNVFDLLKTAQTQWKSKGSEKPAPTPPKRTDTGTILHNPKRTDTEASIDVLPLWTLADLGQTDEIASQIAASTSDGQSTLDLNVRDPDMGQTPLHYASARGHISTVRLLISSGANFSQTNNYGRTPLHLASLSGRVAVAKLLLQHGASIDAKDIWESTPLLLAQNEGNWKTAVLLIQEGADLTDETYYLHSFLEAAASQGNEKAVVRIIGAGAEVQRKNLKGLTPFQIAKRNGHERIAALLLEQTRSVSPSPEVGRRDGEEWEKGGGEGKGEDRLASVFGVALDPSLDGKKMLRRALSKDRRGNKESANEEKSVFSNEGKEGDRVEGKKEDLDVPHAAMTKPISDSKTAGLDRKAGVIVMILSLVGLMTVVVKYLRG